MVRWKDGGGDDSRGYKVTLSEGMLHLFAGSLLVALPHAAGVGVTSMTGIDFNMFGSGSELANITKTLDVTSADATLGSSGTGKIQDLINQDRKSTRLNSSH